MRGGYSTLETDDVEEETNEETAREGDQQRGYD